MFVTSCKVAVLAALLSLSGCWLFMPPGGGGGHGGPGGGGHGGPGFAAQR